MNNTIYISRRQKLFIKPGNGSLPAGYLLNFLKNIESLGYTMSPELAEVVQSLPIEDLVPLYTKLIHDLKATLGAHVRFNPMYPNFPQQVKDAGEDELYTNAFFHYLGDWIGKRILPHYEKKPRPELKDTIRLKVIDLGTEDDFKAIFTRLMSAKTAISESDKQDLEWFVKHYGKDVIPMLPATIPLKENVAVFLSLLLKNGIEAEGLFHIHLKTATDVLRTATAISGGDVSLAENTKFVTVSKKNRRLLLQALEDCGNITEDMLRHKNRWKRLGEKLHPFEYKTRFPKCCAAFDVIRNDKPFDTFNSNVEKAIGSHNMLQAVEILKARPGELARRLDKLVRNAADPDAVISVFRQVAANVSSPVLLQVYAHFKERPHPAELRAFFPKGNVARVKAISHQLPLINPRLCREISDICEQALIQKFKSYKPLGKVFLDENLKNYTVPFALRSASKALKTVSRGSRIDLPPGDTVRFFIYWKDGSERTDLDLSALALDMDSGFKTVIAYYNLKDLGGYHSGDITSAPEGASEFIDVEMAEFLKRGIRYVLMSVNSFTWQPYCDLPICFAGFMMRQHPDSGEIYDPLTVENKFDLTANSRIAIPIIIDLLERKAIWVDLSLSNNPSTQNHVHGNLSSTTVINKAMTTLVRPTLYDLLSMHIAARGERTFDITEANTIFGVQQGIKPTDTDILISEYL